MRRKPFLLHPSLSLEREKKSPLCNFIKLSSIFVFLFLILKFFFLKLLKWGGRNPPDLNKLWVFTYMRTRSIVIFSSCVFWITRVWLCRLLQPVFLLCLYSELGFLDNLVLYFFFLLVCVVWYLVFLLFFSFIHNDDGLSNLVSALY